MRRSVRCLIGTVVIISAFLWSQIPQFRAAFTVCLAYAPGPAQVGSSAAGQLAGQPQSLALEITSDDGRPTSQTPVPPPGAKTRGVWIGRYNREPPVRPGPGPRVADELPADARPHAAVKFVPEMEDGAVRVNVSVLIGRYLDKEKAVASILIHENETVSVPGLDQYNVAAFKVKVVKVLPSIAGPPPAIINKARSIEVVKVEAVDSIRPSSSVKLKNTSDKGIVAIDVRTGGALSEPQGLEGRDLIEPGGIYDLGIFAGESGTTMPDGYMPVGPGQIVINAIVFADGTFEGDADPAANLLAARAGQRTQLVRLVDLLENAVRATDVDLRALRRQVMALSDDVASMGERETALGRYPVLRQVSSAVLTGPFAFGMHRVKQSMANDFKAFENAQGHAGADDMRSWLVATRRKYADWLARL